MQGCAQSVMLRVIITLSDYFIAKKAGAYESEQKVPTEIRQHVGLNY